MRLQKIHSLFVTCLLVSSLLSGIACRETYGLTVEEEKQMGKKILLELDKRLEIIRDPIETEFLDTIGQSLVAEVGPTPYQFRFYFIKGQEPNAFAIPGIAVDTHVHRVSQRIGLTKKDDPVKIEFDLMEIVPKKEWTHFSNLLIWHGRRTCVARKPLCNQCPIVKLCDYGSKQMRM